MKISVVLIGLAGAVIGFIAGYNSQYKGEPVVDYGKTDSLLHVVREKQDSIDAYMVLSAQYEAEADTMKKLAAYYGKQALALRGERQQAVKYKTAPVHQLDSFYTSTKPVKRYTEATDTFTVFTLHSEREIVYRLKLGQVCEEQVRVQDSIISKQAGVISAQDTAILNLHKSVDKGKEVAQIQTTAIYNQMLVEADLRKTNKKLRLQRNVAAGGGLLLSVLSLLF